MDTSLWKPLIICGSTTIDGTVLPPCKFSHLITLAQNIITDLTIIATLLATAGFIYAGFRLMTSGGNPGAKDDAKKFLWNIVKGFVVILVAWVLVYTITSALLKPEFNTVLGEP